MGFLNVRNLSEQTHKALRIRAAQHGRSVEAEIRVGITKRTSFSAAQDTASLGVSSAAPH